MAAHQALPSLGFSGQEHRSGLPFPLPMHESEKWQWKCPTLSDPMDCSPPGSSIHGIFQARVLEWVAIAFSKHFSRLHIYALVYDISLSFWFTSLCLIGSRFIHLIKLTQMHFFLWLSNNFFIHSSINGHLGSFYVLAIVNSAAMNNEIHVSF